MQQLSRSAEAAVVTNTEVAGRTQQRPTVCISRSNCGERALAFTKYTRPAGAAETDPHGPPLCCVEVPFTRKGQTISRPLANQL